MNKNQNHCTFKKQSEQLLGQKNEKKKQIKNAQKLC